MAKDVSHVIVRFQMSKVEFDALLVQMSRRIHDLQNELAAAPARGEAQDPQTRADLAIMEVLRQVILSDVHLIESYTQPEIDTEADE